MTGNIVKRLSSPSGRMLGMQAGTGERNSSLVGEGGSRFDATRPGFLPHLPSSLFFRSHRMVSMPNSKNPEASSADNLNSLQRWEPRPHTHCLRAGAVRKTVF